jgi:hypothetical protein
MQITDIQADRQLNVRKPIKVRKELRFIAICLVVFYYTVGHERPNTFFITLFSCVNVGATYRSKFVKG